MFPLDILPALLFPVLILAALAGIAIVLLMLGVAWETIKRIGHALAWFAVLATVCLAVFGLAIDTRPEASDIVVACAYFLLLPVVALVFLTAVRNRWSARWPLIVLLVALSPSGIVLMVVGMIGLGKLIIWGVGRGNTMASSRLQEPVIATRPYGLVEYASHDK